MVAALLPTGIAAETALAGAVNLHLFLLGVTLLLGLAALLSPRPAPPPDQ
jgi:predicted phage tail protein